MLLSATLLLWIACTCALGSLTIGVREGIYDNTTPASFEDFIKLQFSTNALYIPFQFKHTDYEYMKTALPVILQRGRIPLLIWDMANSKKLNSAFENLENGSEDAYINGFADAVLQSLNKNIVIYVALGNDINTEDSYWRKSPELYMKSVDYVAKKLRQRTALAQVANAVNYQPMYEFVLPVSANYKVLPSVFVPNTSTYNYSLITVAHFGEPEWVEASDLITKTDDMMRKSSDLLDTKTFLMVSTASGGDVIRKADWISDIVDEILKRCAWVSVLMFDNVETGKDTGLYRSVTGDTVVGQNSNGQDLYSYCRLPDILARSGINSWDPENNDGGDPPAPPTDPTSCEAGEQLNANGECEPCPAGSSSEAGSPCVPCSPGTYQPREGASNCIRCSTGQYQALEGMTSCLPCARGSYQGTPGGSSCMLCPFGQYQPSQGQAACIRCPGETTTKVTGATSRDECVCAGTVGFNETSRKCELCPSGQYKPQLSNICTKCPVPNCDCGTGSVFNTLTGQCETNTSSGFVRSYASVLISTLGVICALALLM